MAKTIKYTPTQRKDKQEESFTFGDVMLGDEFYEEEKEEEEDEDDEEEVEEDDDESYLIGAKLPKKKFLGKTKREFHIRIKLNDAPVKIWRELVVPSNITLEMLAYVLIEAMGWGHEHLYQFIWKNRVYFVNSKQLEEQANSLFGFFSGADERNSEETSLEMVLETKGGRLQFEYDFGDSWTHDLWVKASRDYAPNEEPVIKLLKGQGACPPEDCGGVWGYEELLELKQKKRKTADEKDRLEWYGIIKGFNPEDCNLECLQDDVDKLWKRIKEEM